MPPQPSPPPSSSSSLQRGFVRSLGRNAIMISLVSFLNDLSSEIIYPLLPTFLTVTLGASVASLGAIEGAAESAASLLKLASGWWSDRVRRRKPLMVAGYGLAALVRPLIAFARSASTVLLIRLTDRIGKGIRGAPRDALLADSVPLQLRGRAFGMHRAADHAGAVIGPLIAFVVLREGLELRTVFLLAAVPGVLAVAAALFGVREKREGGAGERAGGGMGAAGAARGAPPEHQDATSLHDSRNPSASATTQLAPPASTSERVPLPRRFWAFLGVLVLFTLGNSSDAFLLLRAGQLGVPLAAIPLLWALLHVVKSATSIPGGALSDRVGRRPLIVAGWVWYAVVYLGFAVASSAWHAWALFALYGVMFGLTEGTEKAFIADLAPAARRGSAFGWYNFAIGIAAFPASLLFGAIWDRLGARIAFLVGGSLALAAALGALLVVSRPSNPEPA